MVKNPPNCPGGGTAVGYLLTSVKSNLNSGLTKTNPASGLGGK